MKTKKTRTLEMKKTTASLRKKLKTKVGWFKVDSGRFPTHAEWNTMRVSLEIPTTGLAQYYSSMYQSFPGFGCQSVTEKKLRKEEFKKATKEALQEILFDSSSNTSMRG